MTKIMKGGIAYNSTSNIVALTQAEYNALSTAQKNNGNFYCITDADPSYFSAENIDYDNTDSGLSAINIQDAIDEIDDKFTYSTSEKAVGTWIDGRTVYQKVILINDTISNSWFDADTISGITRIVGAEFIVYEGGARGCGVRQGLFAEISLIDTGVVKIYNNTGYNIQVDYLILKYIKS